MAWGGPVLLDATLQMDYPAAQGAFYLIALAVIISNLMADIAYGLLTPGSASGQVQANEEQRESSAESRSSQGGSRLQHRAP